jgi:hypothetical protein
MHVVRYFVVSFFAGSYANLLFALRLAASFINYLHSGAFLS